MITRKEIISRFENSPANLELKRKKKKTLTSGVVHLGSQRHGKKGTPEFRQTIRYADVSKDGKDYSIRIFNRHILHLNERVKRLQ